ncbi:hypothetical protein KA071_00085 [Candidatus Gracilibacteria bacterium]|nr:hypothetical protein [Candidatus Gracilibacteria bacterium]
MFTSIVYAQTSTFADSASQIYTLEELMTVGIAILLLIAILLTIVFVLWGGFLLVISGGDEHKVHPAINMIRYSVIGLLVMIVIILVTPAVSRAMGFESIGDKFSPGNIFQTMKCVSDRVFGKTDQSCFAVASGQSGFSSGSSSSGIPVFGGSGRSEGGNSPNGVGTWTGDL